MTKQTQAKKNIQYSGELMKYFIKNKVEIAPNSSYVIFVKNDKQFNKMNFMLLDGLKEEGKTVIMATKTTDSKAPWTFASL